MKTRILVPTIAAIIIAGQLPSPAAAQLAGLRSMVPGSGASRAAAVDPDAFLAETIETTKMMMVSAALLAAASSHDQDRDALRARIGAIQGTSSLDELNAHRAKFDDDIQAAKATAADAAALQATYDAASKEQQQMMLSAAYNFTLGMARNVQLSQQAPDLLKNMQSNPMMLRKVGSIRTAGSLIGQQVEAARSMGGPLHTLLSKGGVEIAADAHAAEPKPFEL